MIVFGASLTGVVIGRLVPLLAAARILTGVGCRVGCRGGGRWRRDVVEPAIEDGQGGPALGWASLSAEQAAEQCHTERSSFVRHAPTILRTLLRRAVAEPRGLGVARLDGVGGQHPQTRVLGERLRVDHGHDGVEVHPPERRT